jgi:peptidase M15-like protein
MTKAQQLEEFIDRLGLRHFKGNEFTPYWSSTRKGVKNSIPHESLWPNIMPTLIVLDEFRERLGVTINFNSTYRSPAYNAAVGGEPASFHMQCRAIDFRGDSGTPQEWAKQLRSWRGK